MADDEYGDANFMQWEVNGGASSKQWYSKFGGSSVARGVKGEFEDGESEEDDLVNG